MRTIAARRIAACAVLVTIVIGPHVLAAGLDPSMLEAIRRGDTKAVAALIRSGSNADVSDETGTSALMHAALYASPEILERLIAHGARVNHANTSGATALMWSVGRPENVRALVGRGANINAQAKNGSTALSVAARMGNVETVRMLLAAGADISSPDSRRRVLMGALSSPDPAVRRVLQDAGLALTSASDVTGPVLFRTRDDIDLFRQLLELGVDPKEEVQTNTIRIPTFFAAARDGQLDAMRALVDKGMHAGHVGARRTTALMLAAGADRPNHTALQYLLDHGADLHAVDDSGRTALDWALMRGETDTSAFLRRAGARSAAAPKTLPPAVALPREPRQAVALAIGRLQPAGRAFTDKTGCSSCHNENIPGIAVAMARRHGVKVNDELAEHAWSITQTNWQKRRDNLLLGDTVAQTGLPPNAGYGLLEMAESGRKPTLATDALVIGWARRQQLDGSWDGGETIRPPLNGSGVVQTALAIQGIKTFAPAGMRAEMDRRVAKARAFLIATVPADTQEQAFKLLGLVWSDAPRREIAAQRGILVSLQRSNGGWGQMPTLPSDAYATGQAIYALRTAGTSANDPAIDRGARFLLRTQLEDGTWFVPTRAFGVQPYFETGFPHGPSQFISATATAWAAIALTHAIEPAGHPVTQRVR